MVSTLANKEHGLWGQQTEPHGWTSLLPINGHRGWGDLFPTMCSDAASTCERALASW